MAALGGRSVEELETLIAQRSNLAPPPEEFLGTVVGQRYRVERQLGRGGTAAVYLAEDLTLGRQVALKILSPDLARSARWVHRFRREARAVARLEHPNIVKIYDYGETQSGLLYFVMEYLRGQSLAQLLQEQSPLPILQVRHIAAQICGAIRAAHEERIIHRDLKPGNIVIVPQGELGLVKVLDFGIAKLAEDEGSSSDSPGRLTGIGQTIGTPEYMAPEQVLGELLDHRSDIYALGCILYELITGDVPFSAEPRERVRYKHVFEAPQPPTERRPDVPPALAAVCLRALEKRPEHRFQSMAEMELALEREAVSTLESTPASLAPRGTGERGAEAEPSPTEGGAASAPESARTPSTPPGTGPRPTVLERRGSATAERAQEAWFHQDDRPSPVEALLPRPMLDERPTPVAPGAAEPPGGPHLPFSSEALGDESEARVVARRAPASRVEVAPVVAPRPDALPPLDDAELMPSGRRLWPWLAVGAAAAGVIGLWLLYSQGAMDLRGPAAAGSAQSKAPPPARQLGGRDADVADVATVAPAPVPAALPPPMAPPPATAAPRAEAKEALAAKARRHGAPSSPRRPAATLRAEQLGPELPLPSELPLSSPTER